MRKFVVLGVEGESGLYLVDLQKMTVEQTEAFGATGGNDIADAVATARLNGYAMVKGVDCAVLATGRADAAYQRMSA